MFISFSKIAFAIIFGLDVYGAYYFTGDLRASVFAAVAILLVMIIWERISLIKAGAIPIRNAPEYDRAIIDDAMNEISFRLEQIGCRIHPPRIYIADEPTQNAYTIGTAIVVDAPLVKELDLKAVLSHEIQHVRHGDSLLNMIVTINAVIIGGSFMIAGGLAVFAVVMLVALILGLFLGGGALVGGFLLGKLAMYIHTGFCNILIFCGNVLHSTFLRGFEYSCDRFAFRLGYGDDLINYLSYNAELRKPMGFTERLLSPHLSDRARIAKLERLQEKPTAISNYNR